MLNVNVSTVQRAKSHGLSLYPPVNSVGNKLFMSVADRITKILTEKGLSQRDVERAAGMKKGHLSVILERGGGMHKDTAPRVAEALGVSLGWLLTGEGEAPAAVDARRAKPLSAALSPLPLDRVIDDVFDGRAHKPSDAAAVRALLVGGFTLTSPRDAGALIRTLLDAAAKLRLAGVTKITPSTLLEAVALRVVELEAPAAASEIAPSLAAPSSGRPPSQPGTARRAAGA